MSFRRAWFVALLSMAPLTAACGGDDNDGNAPPGGGGNAGAGGQGANCPEGEESFYETFYAVPACRALYDCVLDAGCASNPNPAQCRAAAEQNWRVVYCFPENAPTQTSEWWAQTCEQSRPGFASQYPACAD